MPRVFRRIVLGLAGLVGVVFLLHVGLDTTHIFHQLFPVKSPEGLVPPFVNTEIAQQPLSFGLRVVLVSRRSHALAPVDAQCGSLRACSFVFVLRIGGRSDGGFGLDLVCNDDTALNLAALGCVI